MANYENSTIESFREINKPENQHIKSSSVPLLRKNYWWTQYKDSKENYKEAFKEAFICLFGYSPDMLDRNFGIAEKFNQATNNKNNQSYWLKFWLESSIKSYAYREGGIYHIPVTEFGGTGHGRYGRATHAETRMAFDLFHSGRTSYFPTDIFMEVGDEVDINVGNLDDPIMGAILYELIDCFCGFSMIYFY